MDGADERAPVLHVERSGAVVTITLDRPDRGNALTAQLKTELLDAVTEAAADSEVRAVVLTGAGKAFCAGQDLAEHAVALQTDPATAFDTIERHYAPIVNTLATMPKPVVAAINGACAGAGLGLALACDLRLAAAGARLSTAFTAIGLTCDSGLSATLVRAVGAARASELILLAEPFTAEQAAQWGVVTQVVPAEELVGSGGAAGRPSRRRTHARLRRGEAGDRWRRRAAARRGAAQRRRSAAPAGR